MLTCLKIHFEEAQEKLKDKLLFFKKRGLLVIVPTVAPDGPTFPLTLAHEQPLYAAHSHQRLREQSDTYPWFTGKLERHRVIFKPRGDKTPGGFIYIPALGSSNNPALDFWIANKSTGVRFKAFIQSGLQTVQSQQHLGRNVDKTETQLLTHE